MISRRAAAPQLRDVGARLWFVSPERPNDSVTLELLRGDEAAAAGHTAAGPGPFLACGDRRDVWR